MLSVDSSVLTKVLVVKKRKEESQPPRRREDRAEGGGRRSLAWGMERGQSLEAGGNKERIPL